MTAKGYQTIILHYKFDDRFRDFSFPIRLTPENISSHISGFLVRRRRKKEVYFKECNRVHGQSNVRQEKQN